MKIDPSNHEFDPFDVQFTDFDSIPEIDLSNIRPLAIADYYDGPESGIVMLHQRLHAFKTIDYLAGCRRYVLLNAHFAENEALDIRLGLEFRALFLVEPQRWKIGEAVGWFLGLDDWFRAP
ncbi:MAG: hypothetical protein Q8Q09_07805 [Deltaproteobacteria bacterium]|nr:hypothetical protein [Deltaproteobacteria bacterium]